MGEYLGDSSVGKVLALKHEGLSLTPENPCKTMGHSGTPYTLSDDKRWPREREICTFISLFKVKFNFIV